MKRQTISFVLVVIALLFYSCAETINSSWKNRTLTIDGDSQDWEGLSLPYNKDMKIVYGVANDDTSLNVIISFNDQELARMCSMRGLTLWLKSGDDEIKNIGIHYQDDKVRNQFMTEMRDRDRQENRDRDPDEQPLPQSRKPQGNFTLAKNDSLTKIPLNDLPGFKAAAGFKNDVYSYEFSFPLTGIEENPYYLNIAGQKTIKVGLEITGMTDEEKERMTAHMDERHHSRPSDRPGGGISGGERPEGGMPDDGRPGGMRGRRDRPHMPDMDGKQFWITVNIATPTN